MNAFYRVLAENPGMTKAEALRQAQVALIGNPDYDHPHYWSAFFLIGNGL